MKQPEDRICEIYGSSEGNVGFVNFLNKVSSFFASNGRCDCFAAV